ncbi:hypothetical protein Acr_00g0013970 [Actinidia rufa]|uniref:Uncharacterized protein n=1 Tax=Actinidia rufa TaxID=165716 RepID=A0A7J0DAS3_9ERIC|nr:hypothetical protein Acr_00g0013970 [Actinidia rufa]
MAPKLSRKGKQSLALGVSTPTTTVSQKRKAKEDLGKEKGKKKRGESSTAKTIERDPLYFTKEDAFERYTLDFSFRKVLNGRWIDLDFFDAQNFDYNSKMDNLGWTPMVTLRDDVYTDLVAHFYANPKLGQDREIIKSYVKEIKIDLNRNIIRNILVLGSGVQPKANTLSLEPRLVHHFICTILIPKMHKSTVKKISLPYGMLLTKNFKNFKVDLDDEQFRVPKAISDEYNEKILKRMGYELKNNQWTPKSATKSEQGNNSKGKETLEREQPEKKSSPTLSKFSNTATTALELSHSPSSSPSTPIHDPHTSTPHTTSLPPPL